MFKVFFVCVQSLFCVFKFICVCSKLIVNLPVLGFNLTISRWYFYWLIFSCLSHGFSLVSPSEKSLGSFISRRSYIHWLKCSKVELKTVLLEFIGMIVVASKIFINVNSTPTQLLPRCFIALKSGWCDCVFTARFKQVNGESSILISKFANLIVS